MCNKEIMELPTLASYCDSAFSGLFIKSVDEENERIYLVSVYGEKKVHRLRVFDTIGGRFYIRLYGRRYYLDEFIKC